MAEAGLLALATQPSEQSVSSSLSYSQQEQSEEASASCQAAL